MPARFAAGFSMSVDLPLALPSTLPGLAALPALAALLLAGTGLPNDVLAAGPLAEPRIVHAVTRSNQLLRFDAADPARLLDRRPLAGLAAGDAIVGLDFRVARGQLHGLGSSGQLYRIDADAALATPIGTPAFGAALATGVVGFDFNPTVDRIRVVTAEGLNARLHPDTGALVDGDGNQDGVQADSTLRFESGDRHAGRTPDVAAAAYTYNKQNEKLTTNFAIDASLGWLLVQGSPEGAPSQVSPNTGRLSSVGALGTGPLTDVSFDIADLDNEALLVATIRGQATLLRVDLATGEAKPIGTIGDGEALRGMAIEP